MNKYISQRNKMILDMQELGMTYSDIAGALCISRAAVAGAIHRNRSTAPDPVKVASRLGIPTSMISDGEEIGTIQELATKHGIKYYTAVMRSINGFKGWSKVSGRPLRNVGGAA